MRKIRIRRTGGELVAIANKDSYAVSGGRRNNSSDARNLRLGNFREVGFRNFGLDTYILKAQPTKGNRQLLGP